MHAHWFSTIAEGGAFSLEPIPDQNCSIEDPIDCIFSLALIGLTAGISDLNEGGCLDGCGGDSGAVLQHI